MAFALQGEHDRAWDLFNMLNPARHGSTPEDIATYRVEPYVAAADVYGVAPHTGRGGWTWYTGSAGWMYRLVTETLLGLQREGDRLIVTPRLPKEWGPFKIHYRFQQTTYHLDIVPASPAPGLVLDGHDLPDNGIPLVDDGGDHTVEIRC
jgi:cellobiose phosphorylase